ncbi:MAG: cell division protein ZapA [Spirochaetaceae bacterium]|jgi:cell division protein ZapA (FtsZ GTPase activity inhibitor)|nr:cell division protein ZapA [Spirochaetaceae bacterium]
MGTLHIDVLGTDFSIAAKEDDRYLMMLLENFKNMARIIEKNNADSTLRPDGIKTAILAGIMLCDELYKEKHRAGENPDGEPNPELNEVERITLEMIDKIDRVLT